ncbi:MAG: serine/threonine-protein kinase RsbW [Actinomycetota bacterium]|jgi:anti-sigma regulatory factor (Ser/Thr protein kinase)|nr:serine/threonine-protein kinase RsbW [Actinomycetota bacterium]
MTRQTIIFNRDIEAHPNALRALRQDLRSSVQELLPEHLTSDLLLAATEAFTNVIRHAYPSGPGGRCHVELSWDGPMVELVIEDEGGAFDPAWCFTDHIQDESGRGFLIIRAVTDEFVCERSSTGGARLVMGKRTGDLDRVQTASSEARAERRRADAEGPATRQHELDDLADADGNADS